MFLSESTNTEVCVGAQEVLSEKSYEVKLSTTGATTDFTGPSPNRFYGEKRERKMEKLAGLMRAMGQLW